MSDADADYFDFIFSNYTGESKEFWKTTSRLVASFCDSLDNTTLLISLIGILANTIHLLVLTRKSMRTQTVNLFLTGIAVCDVARMICVISFMLPTFNTIYLQPRVPIQCIEPQWYVTMGISNICGSISPLANQLSIWYAITIAILRTFVVWFPLNKRICSLIHAKYGLRPFLILTVPVLPIWAISYSQDYVRPFQLWTPPPECNNFPSNFSVMEYHYVVIPIFGGSDMEAYRITHGVQGVFCKLLPSVILPLATIFLILGLNKTRRLLSDETSYSSQRSTKLVIFMTLSFIIANFPLGLLYLTEVAVMKSPGLAYIAARLTSVFGLLNVINATVHFLICFFMSSQYQETVRNMFICCGKQKELTRSISEFTVQKKDKSVNLVRVW